MRASSVNHIILRTLEQGHAHLTAQQIYEHIREDLPAVNPSTIYRSLERLVQAGQISVSDMGLGAAVYETVGGKQHHHIICQGCNRLITIDEEMVQSFFNRVNQQYDFQVATNHLILFGRCSHCKEKAA